MAQGYWSDLIISTNSQGNNRGLFERYLKLLYTIANGISLYTSTCAATTQFEAVNESKADGKLVVMMSLWSTRHTHG